MIVNGIRSNSLTDESNDCTFEKNFFIGESNVKLNKRGNDNNLDATVVITFSNAVLSVEPTMLTPTLVAII
jgi:hypothetical protein